MVSTLIAILLGIIVVFPFIISVCLLFFYKRIGRAPTIRKIADLTTPFLFFSIYIIAHTIFGDGVGYTIAIIALFTMIIYAVYEKRRVKDFQIIRLIRKVWRLYFLILVGGYILLIIVGLVFKVIEDVL